MISQEDKSLELILLYGMNEIEAKAFKISCIYLEKARTFFPNYQHYRLPKGDPRKSELFRYCYKLVREKGDKIPDEEFRLYIHAQLDILRHIKKGDIHPFITPACLAGEKAWKRWLLWKSKYDKMLESKMSTKTASSVNIHSIHKIKKDLWKTKQFIIAWFDRFDIEDLSKSLKDKIIFTWYKTGSICGYFFVLSGIVQKWIKETGIDLKKEFNIDLNQYSSATQKEILEYFETEFPNF